MFSLNALHIEPKISIELPLSVGSCSSNFLIQKESSWYCVSAYHPFLALGYPMCYQTSSGNECRVKINETSEGILKAGIISKQLDFSILEIQNSLLAATPSSTITSLSELPREVQEQLPNWISVQKDSEILMKPARFHSFETTLLLSKTGSSPIKTLEPGDSGQLITTYHDQRLLPLGWAVGNDTKGSHLIPYDRLFNFLDKIEFHQIPKHQ